MSINVTLDMDENATAEETQKFIEEFTADVFAKSQSNLALHGTVDRGTLLKSGKLQFRKMEAEVAYDAPHAMAVENGRSPGTMPPVAAIKGWVLRKMNVKDPDAMAWAVAMKIKERGTAAAPYLQPAIEDSKRKFLQ